MVASATRPGYDIAPRCPVWAPRSGAAAPPRRSRISPTRTPSSIMGSSMAENHPVGFQWVIAGARARRQDHPRRPAVHPHVGDGRHVGPAPRRQRHRLSRRADQLRARARARLPRLRRALHQRRRRSSATTSRTPRISAACSPAGTRQSRSTTRRRGSTRASTSTTQSSGPTIERATAIGKDRGGEAHDLDRRRARPDAAASALRLPGPEAPLRALHAGDGRAASAAFRASAFLRVADAFTAAPRARRRPARSATRSAGRSTRPACRSSAPPRSCSCCSATSAVPAAASWRCAATPRSRARPTSRRSTTSCPAICRCRLRDRHATTLRRRTSRSTRRRSRLVAQLRQVHRLAAEGVVRRRRDRRRTTSASTGCRASPAITRTTATGSTWRTASSKGCS